MLMLNLNMINLIPVASLYFPLPLKHSAVLYCEWQHHFCYKKERNSNISRKGFVCYNTIFLSNMEIYKESTSGAEVHPLRLDNIF